MFIENWQAILVTAILNMLLAFIIFDAPWAARWNHGLTLREFTKGNIFARYGVIVMYSAILVVVIHALEEAEAVLPIGDLSSEVGWLLFLAVLILAPGFSAHRNRLLASLSFVSLSSLIASIVLLVISQFR